MAILPSSLPLTYKKKELCVRLDLAHQPQNFAYQASFIKEKRIDLASMKLWLVDIQTRALGILGKSLILSVVTP